MCHLEGAPPGLVNYSQKRAAMVFDAELYAANGISVEEINAIRGVVSKIDSRKVMAAIRGRRPLRHRRQVRRTLDIRSVRSDYDAVHVRGWSAIMPSTARV